MQFIVVIMIGALLGFILRGKHSLLRPLSSCTLVLLVVVIFFMGTEIEISLLTPVLLLRALALCLAGMSGSILCLACFSFLLKRYAHGTAHHR